MSTKTERKTGALKGVKKTYLFPLVVLLLYVLLYFVSPDNTLIALKKSLSILQTMAIPLALIFILMFVLGIVLNPGKVAKLLGRKSGIKGVALAALTGIISAGPIYAWYPLLKDLKEKGAGESLIVIFLYNRSIKPFLLPVMISYFSPAFVILLTLFTVIASFVEGYCVHLFTSQKR